MIKKICSRVIVFIFALSVGRLFAQPANDLCSGVTALTLGDPCVGGSNVGAADNLSGVVGCQTGSPNTHEDVWYSFVSTGTQFDATFTSSAPFAGNIQYILFSGTCAAPVLVGSQCGASPLTVTTSGLTPGTTYFVVISNGGANANGPFTICNYNTTTPAGGCGGGGTGPTCATPVFISTVISVQTCTTGCNQGNPPGPDFAGGNPCYDFLTATSWTSVNSGIAGNLTVNITSPDLTDPHVAIFYTTDCNTFSQLGCATGSGGIVDLTNIGVPAGSTILIAVNDDGGLQGSYNICVTLNPDNSVCNIGDVITETGSSDPGTPAGGPYSAGEVVNFCYTINQYKKTSCNWLMGIVPNFGNCWDPASFNAQGMPVVTTPLLVAGNETGTWQWYPAGSVIYNNIAGSLPPLTPLPPGWFFQCNTCGVSSPDPDNSWGDGGAPGAPSNDCDINGNGYTWTVCFQLIAGPASNCTNGITDCHVNIKTYADGEVGGWTNTGCTGDQPQNFFANYSCCTAPTITAIANDTICNNTAFNVGLSSNQDPGVAYTWTVVQGLNISGGSNGSGATINQTLTNSGGALSSATYTVVANNGSCSGTSAFTIFVVPSVNVSISAPQTVINCDFPSVTMTASSTSATPSYVWSGGPATADYTISAPGTYTVTVTSTAGCTSTSSQVITSDFSTPTASAGADQMLTCVISSVVLDGSGSTSGGSITYNWSGPAFSSSLQSPTTTTPGTYTLTVENTTTGCTATDTVTITSDPAVPFASAGPDQFITCLVSTVDFDGSGSSTGVNFIYSWVGPGAYSSSVQSPSGLSTPGVYTLTVTNTSNSCTATDQVSIILDNLPPAASAGSSPTITCTTPIVTLDGSGSASGGSITYSWSGPGAFSSSLQSPTTSTPGTYNIFVTNTSTGCTNTSSVIVNINNTLPIADAGVDDTITCTQLFAILGGPGTTTGAGISYVWLGPGSYSSVAQNPSVSTGGTYTFTVTDSTNGCSATDSINIVEDTLNPVANAGPFATINCTDTIVGLDGSGSDSGPGFSIQWTGPNSYSSTILSPNDITDPGLYTIQVTYLPSGCSATSTVMVFLDNNPPDVSAGPDLMLTCAANSDTLAGSSLSSVNYAWTTSNGNIVSGANSANPIIDLNGTYVLTVTDVNNGCTAQDTAFAILNASIPSITIDSITNVSFNGGSDGAVYITVSGGTLPYIYTWSSTDTTEDINNLTAGTYTIIVIDSNGCIAMDSVTINEPPAIILSFSSTDANCNNNDGTAAVSIQSGGNPPYSFLWNDPASQTTATATGLQGGAYIVIVTDSIGSSVTGNVLVNNAGNPVISLTIIHESCPGESDGAVDATITGGTTPYNYLWSNSDTTEDINNLTAGTYIIIVTDNNNCVKEDTAIVNTGAANDCEEWHIYTGITPNGLNPVWVIKGLEPFKPVKVSIFNRWGDVVWTSDDYNNDWAGTNMNGKPLPDGVYFYVVVKTNGEEDKGWVNIAR